MPSLTLAFRLWMRWLPTSVKCKEFREFSMTWQPNHRVQQNGSDMKWTCWTLYIHTSPAAPSTDQCSFNLSTQNRGASTCQREQRSFYVTAGFLETWKLKDYFGNLSRCCCSEMDETKDLVSLVKNYLMGNQGNGKQVKVIFVGGNW